MEASETARLREQWEAEIRALINQRLEIEQKIVGLQTMIKGLDYMDKGMPTEWKLDPVPLPPALEKLHSLGLTDAIRLVLSDAMAPLTPRQVRDRLEAFGYEKLPKANPMAAVHGVLRRLATTGDARDDYEVKGKTAYRFVSPVERTLAQLDKTTRTAFGIGAPEKASETKTGHVNPGASRRLETWLPPKKK